LNVIEQIKEYPEERSLIEFLRFNLVVFREDYEDALEYLIQQLLSIPSNESLLENLNQLREAIDASKIQAAHFLQLNRVEFCGAIERMLHANVRK